MLGKSLAQMGFQGTVYSSPYSRTIETAKIIADKTGTYLVPAAEMREYVIREDQMADFAGATQPERSSPLSSPSSIHSAPQTESSDVALALPSKTSESASSLTPIFTGLLGKSTYK